MTPREMEVFTLVAQGKTNKQIAADLSIGVHTVRTHIERIYAKLGADGRFHAISIGYLNGTLRTAADPVDSPDKTTTEGIQ